MRKIKLKNKIQRNIFNTVYIRIIILFFYTQSLTNQLLVIPIAIDYI